MPFTVYAKLQLCYLYYFWGDVKEMCLGPVYWKGSSMSGDFKAFITICELI